MYALRLIGWMFATLAVCGLVVPMINADKAGNNYSVGSVVTCVVLAALGGLILAIASGWCYGGHLAGRVGSDPQQYRERWGYGPRPSLAAVTVALLASLVPLIGQSLTGASFCDDVFFGWAWLLVSPWVAAGVGGLLCAPRTVRCTCRASR